MMDQERLTTLAEAYGADPRRWPVRDREAAQALLAREPETGRLLHAERALDAALEAWRTASPSHVLRAAVLRGAPRPARRPAWLRAAGTWLSGAGLAAAAAAGVLVGAAAMPSAPRVNDFEAMTSAIYGDAAGSLSNLPEPENLT